MSSVERVGAIKTEAQTLRLFALFLSGADGLFHSIDYPLVWSNLKAARKYRSKIPKIARPMYLIVEFQEHKP